MGERAKVLDALARPRQVLRVDAQQSIAHLAGGAKIRIHTATSVDFGSKLFSATGSDAHVAAVEQRARERGVDLVERRFASEAKLYEAIGLPWIPPEQREGESELERAEATGFDRSEERRVGKARGGR